MSVVNIYLACSICYSVQYMLSICNKDNRHNGNIIWVIMSPSVMKAMCCHTLGRVQSYHHSNVLKAKFLKLRGGFIQMKVRIV